MAASLRVLIEGPQTKLYLEDEIWKGDLRWRRSKKAGQVQTDFF